MKAVTKITFWDHNGEKFFGDGPARLLRGVEASGSLRASAMSMGMAYTKALKLLKQAENALGFPLTTRITGGKSGGGSSLTPEGKAWLCQYEAYADSCREANDKLLRKFFPKVGCVIMASGLGKRFGSNKLMADFAGKPMFLRALQASDDLFDDRIVVTRHQDIGELCQKLGVKAVLHSFPHRSDTIRLGLEALGDVDGCLFMPADQPLLRRETVARMVQQWRTEQETILRPVCNDTPGSPVLFPQWAFQELRTLPEGKGGGWVIRNHPDKTAVLQIKDPFELMDADTPEMLDRLKQHI